MERTIDIIADGNITHVPLSRLTKFQYFQDLLTDNITQIEIPHNPYILQIMSLIDENKNPLNISSANLNQSLKYLRASSFLGRTDARFIRHIEHLIVDNYSLKNIIPCLEDISQMRLMPLFSNLAARVIITYEQKDPQVINMIRGMIGYMSVFKEALIICDTYLFDHNLITANPTIRDIFIFRNRKLKEICQVFEFNQQIVDTFTAFFDKTEFHLEHTNGIPPLIHKDSDYVLRVVKGNKTFEFLGSVLPVNLPNPFVNFENMSNSPFVHRSY